MFGASSGVKQAVGNTRQRRRAAVYRDEKNAFDEKDWKIVGDVKEKCFR